MVIYVNSCTLDKCQTFITNEAKKMTSNSCVPLKKRKLDGNDNLSCILHFLLCISYVL